MSEVSTKRPNVVVLFPDQLRALSLPLFGEQQIETPNIDRLAKQGKVLDGAHHMGAWVGGVCTPSRHMVMPSMHAGAGHVAHRPLSANHRALD